MKETLCEISVNSYEPNIHFTFLDVLGGESYIAYSLVERIDEYKLKNFYRFMYLRILKIHKQFEEVPKMELLKIPINYESFNTHINNYINGNNLLAVLILQSLYHYKNPKYIKKSVGS